MEERKLAALGAPWHPKYSKKIRYFPTHNCTCIDSTLIPVTDVDFVPQYPFKPVHLSTNPSGIFPRKEIPIRGGLLGKILLNMRERYLIGSSREVSYRFSQVLKDSGLPVECFAPVWKPSDMPSKLTLLLDRFVSDRYSITPHRRDYFSPVGFKEKGYPDLYRLEMEEYMWKGKPFATHIRNTWKRDDVSEQHTALESFLKTIDPV